MTVNSYVLIDVLSDVLVEGDTICTDTGFAYQNFHQGFRNKAGQRMLSNNGLAPMGWGLPAAIGCAFATGRRVILLTGDGGLMMNIQELATVMHHKLLIKIFVLNNGGYLTIKQTQQLGFDGRLMGVNPESGLSFPDWWFIRAAHNIPIGNCCEIRNHENLKQRIVDSLYGDGPALTIVHMDPDQPQAPRALNRRNPDGTMNPTKLEDAHPFLPPDVIEQEMK